MRSRRRPRLAVSILWLGLASIAIPSHAESGRQGVVVEEAGEGSVLEEARILPGDLFLSWTNDKGGTGEVRTVFDWLWLRTEQAPRGTLGLRGERDGAVLSLEVPPGPWDFRVRPWMDESALRTYEEGRRRIDAGDVEGGVSLWGQIVPSGGRQDLEPWVLFETGQTWSNAGRGDKARDAWQAGLAEAPDPQARIALQEALGESFQYGGEMARAEAAFRAALETGEAAWGESLQVAGSIAKLGNVLRLQGRTDEALKLQCHALEIRQRLAPDSLEVADSLHQLFHVEAAIEDMEAMADLSARAMAIQERWPADTLSMADALNDVAFLEMYHGYHHDALVTLHRAVAILERRSPGSIADFSQALDLQRRALVIRERLSSGMIEEAQTLQEIGRVYRRTGHPDQAAQLLARAVDALESQVGRLAGSQDLQAEYRASHDEIYRDAIDVELELGHTAEAFHLVERSRARSFLALLAERDLVLSGETGETGKASQRLAALRQSQPLDLAAARKALSRREVERIAEVYPESRLYLGEEATEERARSMTRDARVLHFATHGFTDDRTPLDSALVLTIPAGQDHRESAHRDDGLLQVWEIFESVRLDADLVVLSACESALGREQSGEGLIGLTRAFQYAGARSVVASLWNVADQVTAELMVRFHRHRAAGLPKDEALRAAQIELIREPVRITTDQGRTIEIDASAPFFWAAFQLFGDRL